MLSKGWAILHPFWDSTAYVPADCMRLSESLSRLLLLPLPLSFPTNQLPQKHSEMLSMEGITPKGVTRPLSENSWVPHSKPIFKLPQTELLGHLQSALVTIRFLEDAFQEPWMLNRPGLSHLNKFAAAVAWCPFSKHSCRTKTIEIFLTVSLDKNMSYEKPNNHRWPFLGVVKFFVVIV